MKIRKRTHFRKRPKSSAWASHPGHLHMLCTNKGWIDSIFGGGDSLKVKNQTGSTPEVLNYLDVGDFFGENRLALASNGDFVRSSAFVTGEWDFSESALWLVDTDVGVCGNGSGNEGSPLSRCPWFAKLFCSEDWIGFGLERLSLICCNCCSCCCCWVAISWCCNSWWKAKVCCNICSFSFDCCCCAACDAPDEKPNWKLL